MVSPPFVLNTSSPADNDITSVFPALDRADKATIAAWLSVQWNDYGHTLADYYDGVGSTNGLVSDPSQPAAGTAAVFRNSAGVMAIIDGETGTIQALGVPPGTIIDFAGASAPNGYLLCYGQQVSQTTYANLYAVLGNTWGIASGGNFYLPDLRGRATFGLDNMGGTAAGRISVTMTGTTLGNTGGVEATSITSTYLPASAPAITITDPGHYHGFVITESGTPSGSLAGSFFYQGAEGYTSSYPTVNYMAGGSTGSSSGVITKGTTGISAASANLGTGTIFPTLPPTAIVNKIIKY